jgi:CheY-like chemotaxis protein
MTSDFGETKMQDVVNAGMDSFIFKPFHIHKFEELAIIKNLIEEKKNHAKKILIERQLQKRLSSTLSLNSYDDIQEFNGLHNNNDNITVALREGIVATGGSNSSYINKHNINIQSNNNNNNDGDNNNNDNNNNNNNNNISSNNNNHAYSSKAMCPIMPSLSILVVDDSPTILKLITKMLEKAGHTVETQSTGLGALELLKTKNYDCVLMDINMPQWGGLEVSFEYRIHEYEQKQYFEYIAAEQLQQQNNNNKNNSSSNSSNNSMTDRSTTATSSQPTTTTTMNAAAQVVRLHQKIIAMTGEVNPKLDTEVMFGGFNGILHKPFTLEKFCKIVAPLINK